MMIQCDEHGFVNAFQVSPDLKELIDSSVIISKIIRIDYVYDGDVVDTFYVSESFGKKHGYENSQKQPLPDDYPDWVNLIVPICEQCFMRAEQSEGAG